MMHVPCEPQESLEMAKKIRALEESEVCFRAVCSRAYYAAFHAAYGFHVALPSPGSVGEFARGRHQQLLASLDNPTVPKSRAYWASKVIGKTLRLVYQHRLNSDYFPNMNVTLNNADDALANSSIVVSKSKEEIVI